MLGLLITGLNMLIGQFCLLLKMSEQSAFPPPLSAEEERRCFAAARNGDKSAREKLIEHNLRLVAHIVKKYYGTASNQEDLMSIGTIGLIKAIDSFKPESGTRFATYGSKCLQNEILMYFRAQKKLQNEVSLSETIDVDRDGNPLTYSDIIQVEDTIADDLDTKLKSIAALRAIRHKLTDREKQIIVLRYGLSGERAVTQREIASMLGISRSYVSRRA